MRTKKLSKLFDNLMWYLIYLMPLIVYFGYCGINGNMIEFSTFVSNLGFMPIDTNIIYGTLYNLFGTGGIVPLFANSSVFVYMSYFVSVYLLHLVVDFVLFIPRLAHKYMKVFYQEED